MVTHRALVHIMEWVGEVDQTTMLQTQEQAAPAAQAAAHQERARQVQRERVVRETLAATEMSTLVAAAVALVRLA